MDAVSVFTTGNYPLQPVTVYLFVKSANLPFMLQFISDIIKHVSSTKMSHLFAAFKVLRKHNFFAFISFLHVFMGRQGCSMFFPELVMEWACRVWYQSRPIYMLSL